MVYTFHLIKRGSLCRISAQHARDQTLALPAKKKLGPKRLKLKVDSPGDVRRYYIVAVHYHGESFAIVGLLEWSSTADQHVENHPKTPDVNSWSIVSVSEQNFWGRVCQRATACEKSLARVKFVGEPKVGQFDHAQLFKEDHVLRF